MIKLHGVALSPFVRKVRVALAEKNLPYESIPVMPFGPREEFMKISPLGKIPVLERDGFTVPDSSVIIAYLERTDPQPSLYPTDPQDFARALFLEEYADTRVADKLTTPFFQRFVRANILKEEPDEAKVQQALTEEIPPVLDYLESQITNPEAIIGGRFSIADIAIASPFVNFMHGKESVDASRWPKLAEYVATIHARPSFKALIEEELAFTKG